MTYEQEYKAALEKMLKDASPEAIAICRVWHGEHFGERGWGGVDFVAMALRRAQQAVDALAAEVEKLREVVLKAQEWAAAYPLDASTTTGVHSADNDAADDVYEACCKALAKRRE